MKYVFVLLIINKNTFLSEYKKMQPWKEFETYRICLMIFLKVMSLFLYLRFKLTI